MIESTVTVKGQTTLPKDVRAALGLSSGDKIRYLLLPDGEVRILKTGSAKRLAGMLRDPAKEPISLEQMDAAIAEGASQ